MRLIDADELKKVFNGYHSGIGSQPKFTLGACLQLIDNAPTVEYPFYQEAYQTGYEEGKNERPQGKWVIEHDWVHCFPCGHEQNYPSNFCPNCGADMRKGDES